MIPSKRFALAGSDLDRMRFLGLDNPARPDPWAAQELKSPVPYDPPKLSEYERMKAREKMRQRRKRK